MQFDKDLVAAAATPLVLGILVEGESYGYAIAKQVRELSDGHMDWTDGMLYPLLHRLERLGYVTATWRRSPVGRSRKHYALAEPGLRALADRRRQWTVMDTVLRQVWNPPAIRPAAPTARPAAAQGGG